MRHIQNITHHDVCCGGSTEILGRAYIVLSQGCFFFSARGRTIFVGWVSSALLSAAAAAGTGSIFGQRMRMGTPAAPGLGAAGIEAVGLGFDALVGAEMEEEDGGR